MPQTTFEEQPSAAFNGMRADPGYDSSDRSYENSETTALPLGLMVKKGTADNEMALFSSGAVPLGVTTHSHASLAADESGGVPADTLGEVMRKGRVWVTAEGAVAAGARAYARHTSDGGENTQKGTFRGDADVVTQQVSTVTPTAANDTRFALNVFAGGKLYSFAIVSDSASSATEICDAFRTAMAADTAFTALVVASGTATLILTGQAALSAAFQVTDAGGAGILSVAATTAFAARADAVEGARFLTATSEAGLAILELNLPQ